MRAEGHEIQIQIPGVQLMAKAWGDPDGPPVLGLHGWLDNAGTFDRLAPHLAEFNLVAVDMPGHGRSEHRGADATYHFCDWIRDVYDITDSLGWERFDFIFPAEYWEMTAIQRLVEILRDPAFAGSIEALGGYRTDLTGQVLTPAGKS